MNLSSLLSVCTGFSWVRVGLAVAALALTNAATFLMTTNHNVAQAVEECQKGTEARFDKVSAEFKDFRTQAAKDLKAATDAGEKLAHDAAERAYRMGEQVAQAKVVYVDRVKTITKTVVQLVQSAKETVYVQASNTDSRPVAGGMLSGGFRVLHDSAARAANGGPGDSGAAGTPADAPVDPVVAAQTVATNYGIAGRNAARLVLCRSALSAFIQK